MQINPLHFMWIFYSIAISITYLNLVYFPNIWPRFLIRVFKFGKANKENVKYKSFVQLFEVPKRWFSHFYIFASLYFSFIAIEVCRTYFFGHRSHLLIFLLNHFTQINRTATVAAESVFILSLLLCLQAYRRCYECFYISIFSDSKMNIIHYIVGITFYYGVGLSLLAEAPGFLNKESFSKNFFSNRWFSYNHILGSGLFLLAYFLQFNTHKAFALLRKDTKSNKVVSLDHHIPNGGWFDYISCPHYFAEIIIYFSANIILGGSSYSWWLVCLWTISNQILTGIMSHKWYKETFKNYPSERKAIIPFLL